MGCTWGVDCLLLLGTEDMKLLTAEAFLIQDDVELSIEELTILPVEICPEEWV